MQQQTSFKIDGYILKSVLKNITANHSIGGRTMIHLSGDKIELRTLDIYARIPATSLKEYNLSTEVSNISIYGGFAYVNELPKKHGTDVYMVFIRNDNIFKSEIKLGNLTMTSSLRDLDTSLEVPNIDNTNATIIIHSMNIPIFTQMLRKPSDFYIGSIGNEVRIGSSIESYVSFEGTHNGEDLHTYIYNSRKTLNRLNIKEADSLVIDIDTQNSVALFKWIVDKVLYIANIHVSIQR